MQIDISKEYILCAATWYNRLTPTIAHQVKNIQSGFVLCGHRHHNIIELGNELAGLSLKENDVQGFLTSNNRFVDRKEGAIIFKSQGGTLKYSTDTLYSEDLY